MPMVSIAPVIAWPWRLRFLGPAGCDRGGACIHCGRDVAIASPCRPVCIYCGMERGLVPLNDHPIQ